MKLQGACPARAFFEIRLGAREMSMPVFGIDPLERGNIVHEALERLYTDIASTGGLVRLDKGKLEALIEASVQQSLRPHFAGRDTFGRTLLVIEENRTRDLLAALIGFDCGRAPFEVEATERSEVVRIGPLNLRLRQDRIDRVTTGARFVIDYKTGKLFAISAWRGERPVEPQLPLYAATGAVDGIAAIALNSEGISVLGVGAQALGLDGLRTPTEVAEGESVDWPELVADWRQKFERLAEEFAAGDVRIDRANPAFAEAEFAMLTRIYAREAHSER
jgi:hypothetical protein